MKSAYCEICGERIMRPDFPADASWVHTTPNVWTRSPIHRAWPAPPEGLVWPNSEQAQRLQTIGPVSPDDIAWADSEAVDDAPTDDPWTLHGEAQATLRADGERSPR